MLESKPRPAGFERTLVNVVFISRRLVRARAFAATELGSETGELVHDALWG